MRPKIVKTSDLLRLVHAVTKLRERGSVEEGMGLLHGEPGTGKTTSICYAVNQTQGILIRARVTWAVTSMLQALCRELDLRPHPHRDPMIDAITEALTLNPRPIFVDEADYLLRSRGGRTEMLDALRDIYDLTKVPVILIGMEEIEQTMRLKKYARFDRRLTERVEFQGLTVTDAQRAAGDLCEVHVEGALPEGARTGSVPHEGTLVEALHAKVRGNIGYFVRELGQVEQWAKVNNYTSVTLADWTSRGQHQANGQVNTGGARAVAA